MTNLTKRTAQRKAVSVQAIGNKGLAKSFEKLVNFKAFQMPIFWASVGVLVLHWSRQIGKSYVLAAWAVYRLLTRPGRLVTVLSNSRDNGMEFMGKVREICDLAGVAFEEEDLSPDEFFENMRVEARIKVAGKIGRIKVLAANPRTARGFSGDLILDEFAFHEDSVKIWDAAEPILSSNKDFECRVASTGNGRFNMFYQMCAGAEASATPKNPAGLCTSAAGFIVSRVSRTAAYAMGQKIYDTKTRREVTPAQAREAALDKASYDQNYELTFNDENATLLTHELISACEYPERIGASGEPEYFICEQDWSPEALLFFARCSNILILGQDVGRKHDLSSVTIGERIGGIIFVRGLLRMANMRLPAQQKRLDDVCSLWNFGGALIDLTGIGLGLVEYAQEKHGYHLIQGLNFACREVRDNVQATLAEQATAMSKVKHPTDTALVTELMALDMLKVFEDRSIRIPREQRLRDALRRPQKIVTASGVRIAAESDDAGHADEFWSTALMIRRMKAPPGVMQTTSGIRIGGSLTRRTTFMPRRLGITTARRTVRGGAHV